MDVVAKIKSSAVRQVKRYKESNEYKAICLKSEQELKARIKRELAELEANKK